MLVLAIVALLVPLGLSLRDRVDAEVRLQARAQAEIVAARASGSVSPLRRSELISLARRAAREVRGRVLVTDARGALLADSSGEVARGTPYDDRPEIAAALSGDVTQVQRSSRTLGKDILATAAPVLDGSRTVGAVRVTQSVAAVNRAVRRTWLGLGLIGALVLGLGLVAGALIARGVARPIVRLDAAARRVADGDLTVRAVVEGTAEQRDLAHTFNAMTERLATLLAAQRDFVADASHQLRTPLTGLRLRLEETLVDAVDERQRDDLGRAIGEVDRLTRIVNDLLELSRAGEDPRAPATSDPRAALVRAVERLAAAAQAGGGRLEIVPGGGPASTVVCHAGDLDRMLDVLVENALAYAPGAPVELSVDGSTLRVRDHGPGLATDAVETLFERFHRGPAGLHGPAGTGLGLSIARDLARRWGGEVTLEPAPGGGVVAEIRMRAA